MGEGQSLLRPQGSGQIDPSRRKFDDNGGGASSW